MVPSRELAQEAVTGGGYEFRLAPSSVCPSLVCEMGIIAYTSPGLGRIEWHSSREVLSTALGMQQGLRKGRIEVRVGEEVQ